MHSRAAALAAGANGDDVERVAAHLVRVRWITVDEARGTRPERYGSRMITNKDLGGFCRPCWHSFLSAVAYEAHAYLARVAKEWGIQSMIGLDASFRRTLDLRDLRAFVREHAGEDIGFDAGDEAFSSMIALKLFGDGYAARSTVARSLALVRGKSVCNRYRFFCEANGFAADTDCTSVAAAALYEAGWITAEDLRASGKEILMAAAPKSLPESVNLDETTGGSNGEIRAGVVMVYWDDGREPGVRPRGRKQDAAVAANALYALKLAALVGLEHARGIVEATAAYVHDHLRSGAYRRGTRYYPSPDTFLYYVSCLCRRFPECHAELGDDLLRALEHRGAANAHPGEAHDPAGLLNVAQRAIAAAHLGVPAVARTEIHHLLMSQRADGSWPAAPFYSLGKRALYFGSSAITTMFAVRAIEEYQRAAPAPVTLLST